MIYITTPGGETPLSGHYRKEFLSKEQFFELIKNCRNEVRSWLIYGSIAAVISKRVGFDIGIGDSAPAKLKPGDTILVFEAADYQGVTTGNGVIYSRIDYLGVI